MVVLQNREGRREVPSAQSSSAFNSVHFGLQAPTELTLPESASRFFSRAELVALGFGF